PMELASRNGHAAVIEWWKSSGLELYSCQDAIDLASEGGHVDVLEWLRQSGWELKWTRWVMDLASKNVLEWWKSSGLELKWTPVAVEHAMAMGQTDVVTWWEEMMGDDSTRISSNSAFAFPAMNGLLTKSHNELETVVQNME
ncbi:hypothetical protein BJ742DRAFT_678480, partial [Cladochytrium replicatum]